jgi:hypothetical protein
VPGEDLGGVLWTGERFLAAGWPTSYTSTDGITWTKLPKHIPCTPLVAGPHGLIGASWKGKVWHSPDGETWTVWDRPEGNAIEAIAYGVPERAKP